MEENLKRRRKSDLFKLFYSFFISLFGLFLYIIGTKFIPFPFKPIKKDIFLLFSEISVNLNVSFFVFGILPYILFRGKDNDEEKKLIFDKWCNNIYKFFLLLFSIIFGYFVVYDSSCKIDILDGILLIISFVIINFCLLEGIMQLINKHGICNLTTLIIFYRSLPINWIKGNFKSKTILELLTIFFVIQVIVSLYIFFSNTKWNIPVKNVSSRDPDLESLKSKDFEFSLKFSMSFIPIVYIKDIISIFHFVYWFLIAKKRENLSLSSFKNILESFNSAQIYKSFNNQINSNKNFLQTLFFINDNGLEGKLYSSYNNPTGNNNYFFSCLVINFVYYLSIFFQKITGDWNSGEISKEFQKRGIYFNSIYPGTETKKFLRRSIMNIIAVWFVFTFLLEIFFDVFFVSLLNGGRAISFFNLLNIITIGIDIINQITINYHLMITD